MVSTLWQGLRVVMLSIAGVMAAIWLCWAGAYLYYGVPWSTVDAPRLVWKSELSCGEMALVQVYRGFGDYARFVYVRKRAEKQWSQFILAPLESYWRRGRQSDPEAPGAIRAYGKVVAHFNCETMTLELVDGRTRAATETVADPLKPRPLPISGKTQ